METELSPIKRNNKGQFVKGEPMPLDWITANQKGHIGKPGNKWTKKDKKRMGKSIKKAYKNPELKKKMSDIRKIVFNRPERREKQSIISKQLWKEGKLKAHNQTERTKRLLSKIHKGKTAPLSKTIKQATTLFLKDLNERNFRELEQFKREQQQRREREIKQFNSKWDLIKRYSKQAQDSLSQIPIPNILNKGTPKQKATAISINKGLEAER